MTEPIPFTLDDRELTAEPGQTILEAAALHGVYIPHLCAQRELVPHGSCRVCTVKVNGRHQPACVQPVAPGMVVESDTPELLDIRRAMLEMLYVEGNHICPSCERSGSCELQALHYRLGILAPRFPFMFPLRPVDATHPDIYLDRNRCILCARCVRASRDLDHKLAFGFAQRGPKKHLVVDAAAGLGATSAAATDQAIAVCPVGSLLRKRVGFAVPVGQRLYDRGPIGSEIEQTRNQVPAPAVGPGK
jgi:[NiFe] hydrogenase diaphorase moiety small subunit